VKSKNFCAALSAGALVFGVTACGSSSDTTSSAAPAGSSSAPAEAKLSGNLAGAGASTQAAAQEAWVAGFQTANSGANVAYDPVGSGGGREQFVSGGVDFAGSDAALADTELTMAQKRCGGAANLIEAPVYISPIAIAFKLDGVQDLTLSPDTMAGIFKQKIKMWDDPAIKKDNPSANLPATRITVVNRSDESGTTQNFTDYLSKAAPKVWTFEVTGDWPVKGGEAAQGTSGVVAAIKGGDGTIGYADASQATDLSQVKVMVGGKLVGPTADAAAAVLDASKESSDPGKYVFTYDLDRNTKDTNAYPITLASYEIACTKYDDPKKAALVKGYLSYVISADGQKAAADAAGNAPISDQLRTKIMPAVEAIK